MLASVNHKLLFRFQSINIKFLEIRNFKLIESPEERQTDIANANIRDYSKVIEWPGSDYPTSYSVLL